MEIVVCDYDSSFLNSIAFVVGCSHFRTSTLSIENGIGQAPQRSLLTRWKERGQKGKEKGR